MTEITEPGPLLRRYLAGEHEAVWAEMMALGPRVREKPYVDDAWAVARETMRRARHNVELIIRRLDQIGYRFWNGRQATPTGFSFLGKTIRGPNKARVAAMFDAVRETISAQVPRWPVYPGTLTFLRNAHQATMRPWQDPSLPLKGQRFPLDAKLTELFETAIRTSGPVTSEMLDELQALHVRALDQAINYWKEKGEEPPYFREKREADERRKKEEQAPDHLQDKRVFSSPQKKTVALVRKMAKKGVFVPLSLRAWIEEVGYVNLAGAHPRLCFWADESFPGVYADPLMVMPDPFEMEGWYDEREAGEDEGPLETVLGWDPKAKARLVMDDEQLDYGYSMTLPDPAADAALRGEAHETTFVNYLRIAFRWGGFPGWERREKRPQQELNLLTDGLLPI